MSKVGKFLVSKQAEVLEKIFNEANETAYNAVKAFDGRSDRFGACGFAWVTIDGKSPLANWCRKRIKDFGKGYDNSADAQYAIMIAERDYGSKGYPTGWQFWNPGGYSGQRVDIKEIGARAFRDKLAEYGYSATVGSRLD